jgi:hypothetical protein
MKRILFTARMTMSLALAVLPLTVVVLLASTLPAAGAQIRPFLDCVSIDPLTSIVTARVGYESTFPTPVFFPAGADENFVVPAPPNRPGQTEVFEPGLHHHSFAIAFPADVKILWSLTGIELFADANSPSCHSATFECFGVAGKAAKLPATVRDDPRAATLGRPVYRCLHVPATVGGNPQPFVGRPAHTCYETKPTGAPDETHVTVDNAVGNAQALTMKRSSLVCFDDLPVTP